MGPERNNKEKRESKDYQYRQNKKINKVNMKHEKSKKESFLYDEDNITNILPSGDFDRKEPIKKNDEEVQIKPIDKEVKLDDKDALGYLGDDNLDEEEYEEFDDSYFEQKAYVKR